MQPRAFYCCTKMCENSKSMKTTADAPKMHQNVWKFKTFFLQWNDSRCCQDASKCVKIQNLFLQRKLQQMLPRRQGSQQRQRHLVRFRSHFSCQGISIFHPFSIFSPFFLHFFTLFPFVHTILSAFSFHSFTFSQSSQPAGKEQFSWSKLRQPILSKRNNPQWNRWRIQQNWKYNSKFFMK